MEKTIRIMLYCVLVLLLLLAGCRRAEVNVGPAVRATLTPTPRSTPLPAVATVLPPGVEDNPITMVVRPQSVAAARNAAANFQAALREETGLVIDVVLADRHAEALAALCGAEPESVNVAWLDALSYQAAVERGCGVPVLQVEAEDTELETIQIVADAERNINSLQALRGLTYCRLGSDDYASWLIPSLMMLAAAVDPVSELEAVVDYDDQDALIAAVASGECAATGMTEATFEALANSVQRDLDVVETTPPLPSSILMYPISLTLGERLRLTDGLIALSLVPETAELMTDVLGEAAVARVDGDSFAEVVTFLQRTGLDFDQLGN